ncbi:MAG: polysulfide reductase NrfD [Proteobacteria bacterium]|nr:polysulfide reductase NrfD [Pseudomonadota bacterium]MBU1058071.1 polysulfide reductase NrfD [Pseudomonadota bacterium]
MTIYDKTNTFPLVSMNRVLLFVGLALISGIGLSFGIHSLLVGHDHTFGTSREVPWGILVSPYVFFACLSTGLCIVSSLGQVFAIETFQPIVPRTVFLALITMATGLMCITLELESPWRVGSYALLSPHQSSNIWWKTTIYSLYLIFMVFNFMSLALQKKKRAKVFAIIALVTVTMGNLNMNSDMELLGARGFWSENYMPLYFLSLSTLTGCGAVLLFSWLGKAVSNQTPSIKDNEALKATGKLFMVLLLGILYFTGVKVMGGFFPQFTKNPEAMALLVQGSFAPNFWIGEVGLAVLLPLALILITRGNNSTVLALAGISCLTGVFVLFYDLVIVGQLIPHYFQYHVVDLPQYYSYSPSLHEIMITTGAIFFFLAAFVLGEILFKKVYLS